MDYWDASALVKLFVPEPDSADFRNLAGSRSVLMTSVVVRVELLCTFYRKEAAGELTYGGAMALYRRYQNDCDSGRVVPMPLDDKVMAEAENIVRSAFQPPRPPMVRALDAIHIASAISAHATTVVSTDTRFRAVAALAKLKLLPLNLQ